MAWVQDKRRVYRRAVIEILRSLDLAKKDRIIMVLIH